MTWLYLVAYLAIGIALLLSRAGRDAIRQRDAGFLKAPRWKVRTFYLIICVCAVALWPLLLAHVLSSSWDADDWTPEWMTRRGQATRAAREFALTQDRIEKKPNSVEFSKEDGCWYIGFQVLPELRGGITIIVHPNPMCNVKVDSVTNVASGWDRDMSGWM